MKLRYLRYMLILALLFVSIFSGCSLRDYIPGANNPVECDWVLKVDQTIPVKTDGMTVEYTLVLIAEKKGGTDVSGTYEGAAYIGCKLDISEFSNEVVEMTGGFDINAYGNNIIFDVIPYDINDYTDYGLKKDELGLAPLVEYETMALLSPEMTGTGIVNPNIQGKPEGSVSAEFNESVSSTVPVPMKITIRSGKVNVDLPTLKVGRYFEGQLLGVPKGDSKEYEDVMKKIEKLKKEAKGNGDAPKGDDGGILGNLGGLGDILGKMGTNLDLPESFPSDDIPLMSDANIINVYENDNKKNVRIMYGSNNEYDEVLEFYHKKFIDKLEEKPSPIDVDGGVMYMCDAEGYNNILIMIMKDPSKVYETTVMLEVTKK